MKMIDFVERNIRGAWVVKGILGTRQYYGYTKQNAIKSYQDEAKKNIFVNRSERSEIQ